MKVLISNQIGIEYWIKSINLIWNKVNDINILWETKEWLEQQRKQKEQNGNRNNNNNDGDCNTTDSINLQDVFSKQVRPFRFAVELYTTGGGYGDEKTSDNPISNKSIPVQTTTKIDFWFR